MGDGSTCHYCGYYQCCCLAASLCHACDHREPGSYRRLGRGQWTIYCLSMSLTLREGRFLRDEGEVCGGCKGYAESGEETP